MIRRCGSVQLAANIDDRAEYLRNTGRRLEKVKNRLNIQDPKSAQQEEQFARDAKLATTEKGEAMISLAVNWTADVLRQMIAGK